MDVESGVIDPSKCEHVILSAPGSQSGDCFCCVKEVLGDGQYRTVSYALSCKKVSSSRSIDEYREELDKAADPSDLFIEFTTSNYSFDAGELPSARTGYVCEDNVKSYFGPFSGRAFFAKQTIPKVCFLKATHSHIESQRLIGPATATLILKARAKGQTYRNCSDLVKSIPELVGKKLEMVLKYCCQTNARNEVSNQLVCNCIFSMCIN